MNCLTLRSVLLLAGLVLTGAALSFATAAEPKSSAMLQAALDTARDQGWIEAVVSVSDPRPLLRFSTEVGGWQADSGAALPLSQQSFYLTSPAKGQQARHWLVTDRSRTPGFVRVIAFADPRSVAIRSGANPWDTGGILSLMARSNRTAEVYRAAQALGWNAFNDPSELFLSDVNVKLTNVILRGPDAISISIYERLSPRLPADADLNKLRRPFNSMQSVRDIDMARRFYTEVLGFELLNRGDFINPVRAPNNFGTPANLVVARPLPFAIVGPRKSGPTQVELIQMPGVEGRDLAQRAVPPNHGIMALRFPVSNLKVLKQRLDEHRWPIARGPQLLDLPPWGEVTMLAVQSPDGAWLEFFEQVQHDRP